MMKRNTFLYIALTHELTSQMEKFSKIDALTSVNNSEITVIDKVFLSGLSTQLRLTTNQVQGDGEGWKDN